MRVSLFLSLVSCLGSLAPAAEPPPGLPLFQQRFDALRKSHESSRTSYQTRIKRGNDPAGIEKLEAALRNLDLAYHRDLLILGRDLVILATPGDQPDPAQAPPGLSSSDRRRIENLRQDIRDAERGRITDALEKGAALHGDERTEKKIDRDEQSLDSLFERSTSRLKRDIGQARRDIGREQKSDRPDGQRIAQLEQAIEEAQASVSAHHQYFFGYKAGAGFDHDPEWPADHPAEKLRTAISAARQTTLDRLRGKGEDGGENGWKGGQVGGSYVYSANLGVVLDVSGSMTNFIEPLKKEIAETFSGPRYREATTCLLSARGFNTNGDLSLAARITDTMSVIEELIVVHGVDTIYWFSDLQDDVDFASIRRLRYLFKRGGTAFHVKSVDKRPNRDLEPLITDFQQ